MHDKQPVCFWCCVLLCVVCLQQGAGPMGGGDALMSLLGLVIISFGFRVYTQRETMKRHFPEIVGATILSSIFSLFSTAFAAKAIGLSAGGLGWVGLGRRWCVCGTGCQLSDASRRAGRDQHMRYKHPASCAGVQQPATVMVTGLCLELRTDWGPQRVPDCRCWLLLLVVAVCLAYRPRARPGAAQCDSRAGTAHRTRP